MPEVEATIPTPLPSSPVADELRIALATCGAITLVVYESGVCHELERMVREATPDASGTKGVWSEVFGHVGMRPVIDVLAGASAGGINSVLLGGCLVTQRSFGAYRDVWVKGLDASRMRFGPLEQPDAVLNVQGVFDDARKILLERTASKETSDVDIDIRLCLTDFDGACVSTLDALGHQLDVVSKNTVVHFRRAHLVDPEGVEKAAKAARATSAFPGLFSPVKIDDRWFVDGGLWNNQPIDLALESIRDRRAFQRTTRALLFIEPDPSIGGPEDAGKTPTILGNVLRLPGMGLKGSILPALEGMLDTNCRKHHYDELIDALDIYGDPAKAGVILGALEHRHDAAGPTLLERIRVEQTVLGGGTRRIQSFRSLVNQFNALDQDDTGGREAALWAWASVRLGEAKDADLAREGIRREIADYNAELRKGVNAGDAVKVEMDKRDLYRRLDAVNDFLAGATPNEEASKKESDGFETVPKRLQAIDEAFGSLIDLLDHRRAQYVAPSKAEVESTLANSGAFAESPPDVVGETFEPADKIHLALAAISDLDSKQSVDLVRISPNDVDNQHLIDRSPAGSLTAAQLKLACDGLGHVQGIFDEKWRRNDYVWGRLDAAEVLLRTVQRFAPHGRGFDEAAFQGWLQRLQEDILQDEAHAARMTDFAGGAFPKTQKVATKIIANRSLIGFGNQELTDATDPRVAGKIDGMIDAARRALNGSPTVAVSGLDLLSRIARLFGVATALGGVLVASRASDLNRRVTAVLVWAATVLLVVVLTLLGFQMALVRNVTLGVLGAFASVALGATVGFRWGPAVFAALSAGVGFGALVVSQAPSRPVWLALVVCALAFAWQIVSFRAGSVQAAATEDRAKTAVRGTFALKGDPARGKALLRELRIQLKRQDIVLIPTGPAAYDSAKGVWTQAFALSAGTAKANAFVLFSTVTMVLRDPAFKADRFTVRMGPYLAGVNEKGAFGLTLPRASLVAAEKDPLSFIPKEQ